VTTGAAFLPLALARLAALGLVPEVLVGEKLLLSRCENEISAAIDAFKYSILKLWHLPGSCLPIRYRTTFGKDSLTRPCQAVSQYERLLCALLFEIPAILLPVPFPGQSLLDPLPFTRFQVERVLLYFFDDVFLLHFSLEPAEGVF